MSTLLYITAHPHDASTSYSLSVGEEFVQAYHVAHPQDEVIRLDLYQTNIPHMDADVFSGWGILQSGGAFEHLSPESQAKVARLSELVDQYYISKPLAACLAKDQWLVMNLATAISVSYLPSLAYHSLTAFSLKGCPLPLSKLTPSKIRRSKPRVNWP